MGCTESKPQAAHRFVPKKWTKKGNRVCQIAGTIDDEATHSRSRSSSVDELSFRSTGDEHPPELDSDLLHRSHHRHGLEDFDDTNDASHQGHNPRSPPVANPLHHPVPSRMIAKAAAENSASVSWPLTNGSGSGTDRSGTDGITDSQSGRRRSSMVISSADASYSCGQQSFDDGLLSLGLTPTEECFQSIHCVDGLSLHREERPRADAGEALSLLFPTAASEVEKRGQLDITATVDGLSEAIASSPEVDSSTSEHPPDTPTDNNGFHDAAHRNSAGNPLELSDRSGRSGRSQSTPDSRTTCTTVGTSNSSSCSVVHVSCAQSARSSKSSSASSSSSPMLLVSGRSSSWLSDDLDPYYAASFSSL